MDGTSLEFRPTGDQAYLKTKEQGTPNIRRRNIYVLVNQFACFFFFFNVLLCFAVQVFELVEWVGRHGCDHFHPLFIVKLFKASVGYHVFADSVGTMCMYIWLYIYSIFSSNKDFSELFTGTGLW